MKTIRISLMLLLTTILFASMACDSFLDSGRPSKEQVKNSILESYEGKYGPDLPPRWRGGIPKGFKNMKLIDAKFPKIKIGKSLKSTNNGALPDGYDAGKFENCWSVTVSMSLFLSNGGSAIHELVVEDFDEYKICKKLNDGPWEAVHRSKYW